MILDELDKIADRQTALMELLGIVNEAVLSTPNDFFINYGLGFELIYELMKENESRLLTVAQKMKYGTGADNG